jgi:hypothetical protein
MTGALDAPFAARNGNDEISTAPERLDLDVVHGFLTASYWAAGIARATVERSLAGSLNFGLYSSRSTKRSQRNLHCSVTIPRSSPRVIRSTIERCSSTR